MHTELRAAPWLAHLPVIEINYAPAIRHCQVLITEADGWRDLRPLEMRALDSMLARMATSARAAFA